MLQCFLASTSSLLLRPAGAPSTSRDGALRAGATPPTEVATQVLDTQKQYDTQITRAMFKNLDVVSRARVATSGGDQTVDVLYEA